MFARGEIEALAGFGQIFDLPDEFRSDPRQWWHVHTVPAAALAGCGDAAGSDEGAQPCRKGASAAPAAEAPGVRKS